MQSSQSLLTASLAAAFVLLASNPADAAKKEKVVYRPTYAEPVVAPVQANGSIFQAAGGYAPLTSGSLASRVGDILTIALVERTQATKSNSAKTGRDGSIGLTPPTTGPLSGIISPTDIGASGTQNFKGAGDAAQSNALSGEVTVTIEKVLPNGAMLVRGEKQLTLNRGDEYVQISGIVRPADIGPDNRVSSTRVADARITYTGKGEIARASRQGWLQRFFSMVSPF
ncbi:flagellar basal body L-ring protein FlgH [Sphingobium sufflavum]|uniref:flagellar basal body L-ring protein FlgH n=1 Tax=Sphingobium sufflavum TaxID=1129547 RepID=UPI001F25D2FA|nr:flagellar basal body L-ring protein FlgH [Sphingobium sufflavum]MCE7797342.1 flagellar basal body L-ring protein FlgH [Sphingobium sufflavum]